MSMIWPDATHEQVMTAALSGPSALDATSLQNFVTATGPQGEGGAYGGTGTARAIASRGGKRAADGRPPRAQPGSVRPSATSGAQGGGEEVEGAPGAFVEGGGEKRAPGPGDVIHLSQVTDGDAARGGEGGREGGGQRKGETRKDGSMGRMGSLRSRARVKPSVLQQDVASTLSAMGYVVEVEVLEAKSRYTLDIWLPEYRLAIEVDGPFHYALELYREEEEAGGGGVGDREVDEDFETGNGAAGDARGFGDACGVRDASVIRGRAPLGSTALKHRHLRCSTPNPNRTVNTKGPSCIGREKK